MPAKTYGSAVYGIEEITITIGVNISSGLYYHVVGLPDSATLYTYLFVILLYPGWRFNLSLTIDLLSLRACLPQAGAAPQSS
jgi:hypothetical protein